MKIHFKIRTSPGAGQGTEFPSQLYFDDAFTDQVFTQAPYSTRGNSPAHNGMDSIWVQGGAQLILAVTKVDQIYEARFNSASTHESRPAHVKPSAGHCAFACRLALDYHGRTMAQKRAGTTVKVSVSLDREDVAALKRRARESYDGNLSAAFAEAARWIRQREARRRLIDKLGGPTLTPEAAVAIDAEQEGGPRYQPKKSRRKRAA